MPIIGSGAAAWAMIHTDDAASAYVAAAENPRSGIWHIVDNELVQMQMFLKEFAARLGAPAPRHVPVWLAKWLAGEPAVAYFTKSTRTTNARFRRDFGWVPRYPTYREGLDQVAVAWKNEAAQNTAA
jgi:nucleoside-diphosphate-sugar epimerase